MSSISRILKNKLLHKGKRIVKATPHHDIKELISNLRPKKIDKDLIRLGGESDGGYLLPDDLENISACFSPGVSDIANFELDIASRGINCFMADASVNDSPVRHPLLNFERKFIGMFNNHEYVTLDSWVNSKIISNDSDLLLQMDIEGSEYQVLLDCNDSLLNKFRILIIEFHNLDRLVERNVFPFMNQVFQKILKNFVVVHIHPNNNDPSVFYHDLIIPHTMEFTFIRCDRVPNSIHYNNIYPHSLDRRNNVHKPDIILPSVWFC